MGKISKSFPAHTGTRPTDYHVLHNEIGFSANDLHELLHFLSYVYQRSTTAVSVVAPICYARLALLRCRNSANSMKCPTHLLVTMGNICKNSTTLFSDKS